ncbi:MAG: hypothetical protein V7L11_21855 [Nostoc sp.]|uniref:hypothetical protein n=1 Tax=Nostoc sp. TaxID=1180 RepID=UPI002FFAED48
MGIGDWGLGIGDWGLESLKIKYVNSDPNQNIEPHATLSRVRFKSNTNSESLAQPAAAIASFFG